MRKFTLEYIAGVEGNSIYLNEYRIAGPKPWGGGKVIKEWTVEADDLERALGMKENSINTEEVD